MVGPFIYIYIYYFFVVDRFKTFISLQIPFKHLLWIPPQAVIASRASEGEHCLLITCHWLLGKLEHVQVVRLRYGKAEARSDTRKEVRRLGSREVVAFRKRGSQRGKEENLASKAIYIAFQVPRFASVT